jgi:hypothetical protein
VFILYGHLKEVNLKKSQVQTVAKVSGNRSSVQGISGEDHDDFAVICPVCRSVPQDQVTETLNQYSGLNPELNTIKDKLESLDFG